MAYEKTTNLTFVRFLTLLFGFTFAIFTLQDFYFHRTESAFLLSVALRCFALLIALVFFFMAGSIERYDHTLMLITVMELVIFVIYLVILYILTDAEPALQFMTVLLFILVVFLIPNKWKNCLISAFVILFGYILFCAVFQDSTLSPSLTARGLYLGICLLSCTVFLYRREKLQRRQFASEQLLEFMSITDRLTGIYNRGRFEHILNLWIKGMRHDPFCLLLFDIDNFKGVNDHFGHSRGDQVLIQISKTITANIRVDDVFARWGGEEFVILFGETDMAQAVELAGRLRKAVEDSSFDEAGKITISIGVAEYQREESILDFLNRADERMYKAKRAGKNRVVADSPPEPATQIQEENPA